MHDIWEPSGTKLRPNRPMRPVFDPLDRRGGFFASFAPFAMLASQPWDWMAPLIQQIRDWLSSDAVTELPANAGLFLITGGLSILTLIVSLVFLQSVLPMKPSPITEQGLPTDRALRPLRAPGAFQPVQTGKPKSPLYHPMDALFESMVLGNLGDPRVLTHVGNLSRVRLYGCPGCASGFIDETAPKVCSRELRMLESSFFSFYQRSVSATEVSCRLRGESHCEFEVRH